MTTASQIHLQVINGTIHSKPRLYIFVQSQNQMFIIRNSHTLKCRLIKGFSCPWPQHTSQYLNLGMTYQHVNSGYDIIIPFYDII